MTSDAPVPPACRGGVVALGNFDGFHRGHQAVVGRAVARARAEGRPALVATFDPHPATFFRSDLPPFRLTTLDQRARLFAEAGIDATYVIRFDAATADVSPEAFVAEWLVERIGAAAAISGRDFTFGRARGGTVADLARLGADLGLAAEAVAPVADADGAISSTRIRAALRAGDLAEAARMLTRPFAIEAVVAPDGRLPLGDYARPRPGHYVARIADTEATALIDGDHLMASAGLTPGATAEVHLLARDDAAASIR